MSDGFFMATSCDAGLRLDELKIRWNAFVDEQPIPSVRKRFYDGSEVGVKEVFDNITYGCTYTVWRLTAEKDWQAYVDEMKRQGKPIPGVDTGTGDVAPQTGERKVKTVSGASAEETKTGGVTKPVQPAIDVKGAVERIDIPDLPAFPGSSEYEEQKREAEAGRGG